MQERRDIRRGRTLLGGWVVLNGRRSTLDCVVRNLSQDGARISLVSTALLPPTFEIMIRSQADIRAARVVWRDGTQAGIAFGGASMDRHPRGPAPPDWTIDAA